MNVERKWISSVVSIEDVSATPGPKGPCFPTLVVGSGAANRRVSSGAD